MFPVLLAEEDCSIKRGQPSITRDLPKSSSFLAEVFLIITYITIFLLLSLQKELQNLEDAGDELLMLEDDTAPIPYPYLKKKKIQCSHVGSVVSLSHREYSSSDPFFCHKGQVRVLSSSKVLTQVCTKLRLDQLITVKPGQAYPPRIH